MNAFCEQSGKYIAAPAKPVKDVPFIGVDTHTGIVYLYETNCLVNGCKAMATLVRVVLLTENYVVVETKNSVYRGKPS